MNTMIRDLARARAFLADIKADKQRMLDQVMQSEDWLNLEDQQTQTAAMIETLETQVRDAGIEQFKKDGTRNPHDAISIVGKTVFEYDDEKAIFYCQRNARVALDIRLNKKVFESIAKKQDLPFVTIETEYHAQIKKDLTPWLDGE